MSANKLANRQLAERMSRDFVRDFWSSRYERLALVLAPDFTWIGAQEEQYALDRTTMLELYKRISGDFGKVVLGEEEYQCVSACGSAYVVVGRYIGYSDPKRGQVFAARQRVTLVWSKKGDEPLTLRHYHVSNPLELADPGETFPLRYAQQTGRFVHALLNYRLDDQITVALKDTHGHTHLVHMFEIIYLAAKGQCTDIFTLGGHFTVRRGITETLGDIDADEKSLVRIHRGYAVNASFAKTLSAEKLILSDGTELPISTKRSTKARQRIAEIATAAAKAQEQGLQYEE